MRRRRMRVHCTNPILTTNPIRRSRKKKERDRRDTEGERVVRTLGSRL
jgi:hypothetical protein